MSNDVTPLYIMHYLEEGYITDVIDEKFNSCDEDSDDQIFCTIITEDSFLMFLHFDSVYHIGMRTFSFLFCK